MKALVVVFLIIALGAGGFAGFQTMQVQKKTVEADKIAAEKAVADEGKTEAEANLTKALADVSAKSDQVTALEAKLKTAVDDAKTVQAKLSQDLTTAKTAQANAEAAAKKAKDGMDAEMQGLKASNTGLEEKAKKLDADLQKARADFESLKANLAAKEKEFSAEKEDIKRKITAVEETNQKLSHIGVQRSIWRGTVMLESEKADVAAVEFSAAVESEPENADALRGLALAYEALGQKTDAVKAWTAFIGTGPEKDDLAAAQKRVEELSKE